MTKLLPIWLLSLAACTGTGTDDGVHASSIAQAVCPPPTLFSNAVCVCENLDHVGALSVKPGPGGTGSVGVNGRTNLVGLAQISGTLVSYEGLDAVGATIGESLVTNGDAHSTGDLHIGKDLTVGGDLTCVGNVEVRGNLALGGQDHVLGSETIANRKPFSAPALPCNCDPATFFDVDGAVAAAKQATNGVSSFSHLGAQVIHLTGGNYYARSTDVVGLTAINVDAPSSVFIDGSLASVGATVWKLAPNATLDLFISGDVAQVGQLIAGNPADPTAFRLYIGGSQGATVGSVGEARFFGSIYAPRSVLAYVGDAVIVGSIFAKSIAGVGALAIDYSAGAQAPTSCQPPGGGSGSGSGGGSGSGTQPSSDGPVFL